MPYIDVDQARYTYPNGYEAVSGVSLQIERGESVAIIGQNGAGKTTFVKMLNGLLRPSSGVVRIDGVPTSERTPAQTARYVGYVFQNPDDQIFNSSVGKEVGYALKRIGGERDIDSLVREACDLCGLGDELDTNPYDLPLSIRKFITIASVIAVDPEVYILDEPTAGQDLYGLERIANIIAHLQAQGKIVMTITHDMAFVAQHFERVIVMANTQIIEDGDVNSVFYHQETMRQARLNPPVVPEVAQALGLGEVGVSVDALGRALLARG